MFLAKSIKNINFISKSFFSTANGVFKLDSSKSINSSIPNFDNLDFPYNFHGFLNEVPSKAKYIADQIFIRNKIPISFLHDHLSKIYFGTLYSIVAKDIEFFNEYLEEGFRSKLLSSLESLKNNNLRLEIYQDVTGDKGEPILNQINIKDMVLVRGLSRNRNDNLDQDQYHKFEDIEEMGIVVYTPIEITDTRNFIDPTRNKIIYEGYKKAILRILAEIKTSLRLKIIKNDGSELKLEDDSYNFKHLVLFESQLKPIAPLKSSYKLENYLEWLSKFNIGNWIISDLDNCMKGNPLIISKNSTEFYKDEIFKGSKYDPEININLRKV